MASNTENVELKKALYKLVTDVSVETENYIESRGRLIRLPMEARLKPIMEIIQQEANRQKAELLERLQKAQPKLKEKTSSTEFTTWDRKTKIVKTFENHGDAGYNRAVKDFNIVIEAERKKLSGGENVAQTPNSGGEKCNVSTVLGGENVGGK